MLSFNTMGLNYSFNLYYPLDRLESVLLQLPSIANTQDGNRTEIELPNGKYIVLPFTSGFENKSIKLVSHQESIDLDTSLNFPIDEHIQEFVREHYALPDIGRIVSIGYIYLYIAIGKKYAELSFTAATSSMSRLFLDSRSIQDTFIDLMRSTGCLFGLIDVEEYYYLSLTDLNRQINIDTSDIEVDFSPCYDVDLFVDRYFAQIANK